MQDSQSSTLNFHLKSSPVWNNLSKPSICTEKHILTYHRCSWDNNFSLMSQTFPSKAEGYHHQVYSLWYAYDLFLTWKRLLTKILYLIQQWFYSIVQCNFLFLPSFEPFPLLPLLSFLCSTPFLYFAQLSLPSDIFIILRHKIGPLFSGSCDPIPCCTKLTLLQAAALLTHSKAAAFTSVDLVQQGMMCQL